MSDVTKRFLMYYSYSLQSLYRNWNPGIEVGKQYIYLRFSAQKSKLFEQTEKTNKTI